MLDWGLLLLETLSPNGLVGKIITSNAAGALELSKRSTVSTEK
jgi:hypothetical protein